jgi:hypothetical protein
MTNVVAPRGFQPRKYSDARPFNGGLTGYHIASAYGSNIFVGDPVTLVSGKINVASVTAQIRGIAAEFTGTLSSTPAGNPFMAYWAASSALLGGVDGYVGVIDDPDVLFEAQFLNSTTVPAVADIGSYFNGYNAGGSTASGLSGFGIDYSTKSSSSSGMVWRFVDFVVRPNNDTTSAYSRGLFMPILHDMRVNAGAT